MIMQAGIIGGTGKMGRLFVPVFERAGYDVLVSGRSTRLSAADLASSCELVIVSVPIRDTVASFREILSGNTDALPEQAFFLIGGLDDLAKKARILMDAVVHAAEAGVLRADHYLHLRCEVSSPDVVEVFDQLGNHDRVLMMSLMDHTPGQRQYADIEAFRTYMVGRGRLSNDQFDEHVSLLQELAARYSDTNGYSIDGGRHFAAGRTRFRGCARRGAPNAGTWRPRHGKARRAPANR